MRPRPEARHAVDFQVYLSWQLGNGTIRRVPGRCVNLSPSGAKLETRDRLELRSQILLHSEEFGRMGTATIRYCNRRGMNYDVGLEFNIVFGLSDPVRRKILESVLRSQPAAPAPAAAAQAPPVARRV